MEELNYEKYKRKVKLWEKQFKVVKGRPPSKHDIRENKSIHEAYKMYYKLKTSFLEETLSQTLDDDCLDFSFELTQNDTGLLPEDTSQSLTSNPNQIETFPPPNTAQFSNFNQINLLSLTNLKNVNENHVITEFEAEHTEKCNENAWTTTVASTATKENLQRNNSRNSIGRNVGKVMTEKLFKNSSFSKRNPRKSLSRTSSHNTNSSSSLMSQNSMEILPDLETILAQKALQQQTQSKEETIAQSSLVQTSQKLNINIDQGWLDRCTQSTGFDLVQTSSLNSQNNVHSTFGLSNINSDILSKSQAVQSTPSFGMSGLVITEYANNESEDDVIENSDNEERSTRLGSLRHVLKKRKICQIDVVAEQVQPVAQPPNIKSPELKTNSIKKTMKKKSSTKTGPPKSTQKESTTRKENIRRSSRNAAVKTVVYSEKKSGDEYSPFDDSDADANYEMPKPVLEEKSVIKKQSKRTRNSKKKATEICDKKAIETNQKFKEKSNRIL